nr:hypothetical protein Hi04_10k_c2441B_00014 [uncultured bacterium]
MKAESDDRDAIRIMQQFRSGHSMVYDLRSTMGRLTLRVTGRGDTDAVAPTEWRIDAATHGAADAVVVTETASTRADALHAVGRSWSQKRVACDLPIFDWAAVALAMRAVRAI